MLPAALALLVWLPAILGYGAWWRTEGPPLRALGLAGLVGLATMSALATALHLFAPISPPVAAGALVAGWALLAAYARRLLRGLRPGHAAGVILVALFLAAVTQLPARHYDAGLYQLQAVKWIREWAQIPGLASLHSRFGFNSSWFALAAFVETPWLRGGSPFFLNAFPVLFTLLLSADALGRFRAGERTGSNAYFLLAAFAGLQGLDGLGSLNTDAPATIASVVSFGLMLRALEEERERAPSVPLGLFLAAFAVTVKLSAALLVAGWVAVALRLARRGDLPPRRRALAASAALALGLPWVAHGLVASGCLLFPVTASCLPALPWATPASVVGDVNDWIRSWSRWPGYAPELAPAGWGWLPRWGRALLNNPHTLVPLAFGAAGALWVRRGLLAWPPGRAPLAVAAAGLAWWFVSAPDPRFGLGFLVPLALLPLACGLATRWEGLRPTGRMAFVAAAVAAALWSGWWSVRPLRKLRPATYAFRSWPALPSPPLERRVTLPGTAVWVPAESDQCWDAPLPCTPQYDASLEWTAGGMFLRDLPAAPPRRR